MYIIGKDENNFWGIKKILRNIYVIVLAYYIKYLCIS